MFEEFGGSGGKRQGVGDDSAGVSTVRRFGTRGEQGSRFVGSPIDENLPPTRLKECLGIVEIHLHIRGERRTRHALAQASGKCPQQDTETRTRLKI